MTLALSRTSLPPALLANAAPMASAGLLEVRLAASPAEIAAAQALRYAIFYEEMGARPTPAMAQARRDFDEHDGVCDHLLVIDHADPLSPRVVGTYRLLRQDVAMAAKGGAGGGFYSAQEFDLSALIAQATPARQLLELGRSCVAPEWRTSATISLLWRGIAQYLVDHNIGHMIGCASLHGADPALHVAELAYLHHHHLAPPELRGTALPPHRAEMNLLPATAIDPRACARALPPLIKAYLRVGAYVGDGAFVDHQFNTVDVLVVMPVDRITSRYAMRFGAAND